MISFIISVVGFLFFYSINNRLSALENKIKFLEGGNKVATGADQISQVAVQNEANNIPQVNVVEPGVDQVTVVPVQKEYEEESLGRTLGIIGVFAVLFGIGFFLKYAFDNNLIGITGRLFLGAGVGVLAIVLGRLIKSTYEKYGHILSGGGIGILFVTAYASHALYHVVSSPVAYAMFAMITAVSVILSILDGQMLLAGIGVAGGFIAPSLISVGADTINLLAYVLVLNIGVAMIAFRYKWLPLQYISFLGTFLIMITEYVRSIQDEHLTLFFFASIYFAIFLASSIFHHLIRKEISTEEDLFFITINAALYAVLSYIILDPLIHDAMGLFAVGLAFVYFFLGYLSFTTHKEDHLLNIALPMIGVVFLTVAVPLNFDGKWITVGWLTEAVALALIDYAILGKRLYTYAVLVYMTGLFRLLIVDSYISLDNFVPVFNERFVLFGFVVICGLLIAYTIRKAMDRDTSHDNDDGISLSGLSSFVGVVSQVVTLFLLTTEIHNYFASDISQGSGYVNRSSEESTVVSIVWALYAAFLTLVGFVSHMKSARILGITLFIITAIKVFFDLWALGPLYRIVTSIVFGIIALSASFLYARFKDRLKDVL